MAEGANMNIVILLAVMEMLRQEYPEARELIDELETTITAGCPVPKGEFDRMVHVLSMLRSD